MNFPRCLAMALCLGLHLLSMPVLSAQGVVYLEQGDDFQTKIEANPAGTTFVVRSGIHRAQHMEPKDGSTIMGEPGAILSGAVVLPNWRYEAPYWVHDGPHPRVPDIPLSSVVCALFTCAYPQDLFKDGEFLNHVVTLNDVSHDGAWYWDTVADRIYVRFNPNQHLVELGGPKGSAISSVTSRPGYGKNLLIKNLIIERYPTPPLSAAASAKDGSVIEDCEFRYNHAGGGGIADNCIIRRCYAHHNGQTGLTVLGTGNLVEDNETSYNVRYEFKNAWQNGGIKSVHTTNLIVRRNYSHHNSGVGFWTDIDAKDTLYEGNISEDNEWEGFLIEVSCGAILRNNVVRNNGLSSRGSLWGAQICVQNTKNTEIHHNYCETPLSPNATSNGIVYINQGRGGGECGLWFTDHGYVHDNVVVSGRGNANGMSYGTTGWNSHADFLASANHWERNHYHVGRPLNTSWFWWTAENNYAGDYFGKNLSYPKWLALGEDGGSTFQTHTPEFFAQAGTHLLPLIAATVDFDYPARKAALTHVQTSTTDTDGDGMPDAWERRYYLNPNANDSQNDTDGDTLTNLQEYQAGTSPSNRDTDLDRLPDKWELDQLLNPLQANGAEDPDSDSLTNFEEYEESSPPLSAQVPPAGLPEDAISFWAKADAQLSSDAQGNVTSWREVGPQNRLMVTPAGTKIQPANFPIAGLSMVVGSQGIFSFSSINTFTNFQDQGFTMFLVLQPLAVDANRIPRAVLTNETYHDAGFRLVSHSGYFLLATQEDGGTLTLSGVEPLVASQPLMLCVSYGGNGGLDRSALYINGKEQDSTTGEIKPSAGALGLSSIGGLESQQAGYSELLIFNRQLTHLQRRTVDAMLMNKYFLPSAPRTDSDYDGMPDSYETANGLDPGTTNGSADKDGDGLSNLAEFQNATNPSVVDTDLDGMPDGWEVSHGLNPLASDASLDPDGDSLSNVEEFRDSSDPQIAKSILSVLPFQKLAAWLKADQGLPAPPAGSLAQWQDQSGRARHALSSGTGTGPTLSPTQLNGRPVLDFSTGRLVAARNSTDAVVGAAGFTLLAVLRPVAVPQGGGNFEFAGMTVGSSGGFQLGLQNQRLRAWSTDRSGTLNLTSTAPLTPGSAVVTSLQYGGPGGLSALSINGVEQTSTTGASILSCPGGIRLGAGPGQSAAQMEIAELLLFHSPLRNTERRAAEAYLRGKWLNEGPAAGDSDGDGMPDWWELEFTCAPLVPDAGADADWNGVSNLSAFLQGQRGFTWLDNDHDGMLDTWETAKGLNTSADDSAGDLNGDSISNLIEFTIGLSPNQSAVGNSALTVEFENGAPLLAYALSRSAWFSTLVPEWSAQLSPAGWNRDQFEELGATASTASDRIQYRAVSRGPQLPRCFYRLRLIPNE